MLRINAQEREARDRIGESGREGKKRKKPLRSCRRDVGNGTNFDGNREKRRQKSVGSVTADPEGLEKSKETGREAQDTQGFMNQCTSRGSVSSLSHLIRGFRNKYHWSSLERPMRVAYRKII